MGRTHIVAMDIGIGLLHIIAVFLHRVAQTTQVVMGVVAHLMALCQDTGIELRVLTYVVAHHEEGGTGAIGLQGVEDEGGSLWDRAVVEGQVHCLHTTVHTPVCSWIEPTKI